jgi:2-polyprenyl-6-methoxyphenol hydroxylase-like FAD-dependent oxidoreductase
MSAEDDQSEQVGGRRRRAGDAVVVGGSLSGLMTALALSRGGVDVTILERAAAVRETGAALRVDEDLLQRLTGRRTGPQHAPGIGVQAWTAVHDLLRTALESDPHVQLRHDTTVQTVGFDEDSAWAVTADGEVVHGDVVIGADGHRSVVRRSVSPQAPDATFAGYVLWLGIADEAAIPSAHRWPQEVAYLSSREDLLLGYPLPGRDGSGRTGGRQLGWAWFDTSRKDLLRDTGAVVDGVVQRSLPPAEVPQAVLDELAAEAPDRWPAPWCDAVRDVIDRRAVIGTPVAEYLPDRLVAGRIALVGDAAHVPTPMTGTGFNESLRDAEAIAEAVVTGLRAGSIPRALRGYERRRLGPVRSMVRSGQEFSRSFADGQGSALRDRSR